MTEEQVMKGNRLLTLIDKAKGCLNAISPDKVDYKPRLPLDYVNTLPAKVIGVTVYYDGQQSDQNIILTRLLLDAPESLRETIVKLSDNAASEIKAIVEKYYADVINIAEQKLAEL